jgi:hypothetical protein
MPVSLKIASLPSRLVRVPARDAGTYRYRECREITSLAINHYNYHINYHKGQLSTD